MIDLAENGGDKYIPMKKVAERQGVSLKYLERILPVLTKAGLVDAVHGTGGGYRLSRRPEEYTVYEVLDLAEGGLAPVACLADDAEPCARSGECRTISMWRDYYEMTKNFFSSLSIADLMENKGDWNSYII